MPIHFKCPTCKRRLSVGSQKAGKDAQCPNCGATIRIPTQEDAAAMKAMLGGEGTAPVEPAAAADFTQFRFEEDAAPVPPEPPPDLSVLPEPPAAPTVSFDTANTTNKFNKDNTANTADETFDPAYVSLSRRVLYIQGILLGAVALGCFLLGYLSGMVGGGGKQAQTVSPEQAAITVSGRLYYQPKPGQSTPDSGAVLILFPAAASLDEQLPATGLKPADPLPKTEPHSVRVIQSLGGVYVRTGKAGDYKFALSKPGKYHVLRLSRHAAQAPGDGPAFKDLDTLEKYFSGAEELLGNHKYTWSIIEVKQGTTLAYDFGVDGG